MKRKVLFMALAAFAAAAIGTAWAAELKWTGCGITKKAFMEELAARYEQKTGTKVVVVGGGATKGITGVAGGEFDMGGTCRHKTAAADEKDAMLHQVAWDALVVIVNEANPVDNVSTAQIKDVLTGKIANWKELGGADEPIKLYVRKGKQSGVGLMAREILFGDPNQEFSPSAEEKKSSGPVEAAISRDRQGVGITGVSSAKKREYLKVLSVDGVAPTKENIQSGRYPLYRPLYLVTRGEPSGEVKRFVDFARSAEGQAIISSQGTVNLEEGKSLRMR
ncbi:MAG: hypothetical protein Kow0025_21930 [Thermodesulfovibrionales bacterium]